MGDLIALLSPFLIYFWGILSPGPANIAIMQISLEQGRNKGIIFACGVITGSIFWGLLAVFGLGKIIVQYPQWLKIVVLLGGTYMAWLGYENIKKSILITSNANMSTHQNNTSALKKIYIKGLLIHLTNPKAILVWTAIILVALDNQHHFYISPYLILVGCGLIGVFVFCGYAIVFSDKKIISIYNKISRFINLIVGIIFTMVSIQLFLTFFEGMV